MDPLNEIRCNMYLDTFMESKLLKKKIKIIYADFTASGKPYKKIEKWIAKHIYPYYANVHSNAYCGQKMTNYIEGSRQNIKHSLNCNNNDTILFTGDGCSSSIMHFTHILNLKQTNPSETVVFITDIEHNSNFLPWKELPIKLVIVKVNKFGIVESFELENILKEHKNFSKKIISFSACSNVIGVQQDISMISKIGHKNGCIVCFDFASNAPYINIDMHKDDKNGDFIDAAFISIHKYLGGVGTPGLLVFNQFLNCCKCPYRSSGGTVRYVSSNYKIYSKSLITRESGGTPDIIGCIKAGLVFVLHDNLLQYITNKNKIIVQYVSEKLKNINSIDLLNLSFNNIIPIFSFIVHGYHYNYIVALLNDIYGIQSRGGVSCSGLLAEKILHLSKKKESEIIKIITSGNGVPKDYGWIRITFHYTMNRKEIDFIINAINNIALDAQKYFHKYKYLPEKNKWINK